MPKITDEYNNPFDKDAPRTKRFAIAVNDYDLYEIAYQAKKTKGSKTEFARYSMNLPLDVKIGAAKGNQNAKKKEGKADREAI